MPQALLTESEYRTITGDSSTAASAVSAKMESALDLIEEYLERNLESGEFTETLEVWYDSGFTFVYPLVTPVTDVPASAAYVVDELPTRIRGVSLDAAVGTWPTGSVVYGSGSLSPYSPNRPDYATITYTGGFTNDTFPYTLKVYMATLTRRLITWTPQTQVGAQEVSVGDVRVKYPAIKSALDALVPGMSLGLKPYKRKRVRFG